MPTIAFYRSGADGIAIVLDNRIIAIAINQEARDAMEAAGTIGDLPPYIG